MKLADNAYNSIKPHMASHAQWHVARIPKRLVPVNERAAWSAARAAFPTMVPWDQRGAGEQFLKFHREMLNHFNQMFPPKSAVAAACTPWTTLPEKLRDCFSKEYWVAFDAKVEQLIECGTLDELGNFLEATDLDTSLGSGVHNLAHGFIAYLEANEHPTHPRLVDAGMDSPFTAHHNELFWRLHGWIDGFYEEWERRHPPAGGGAVTVRNTMGHGGHTPVAMMRGSPKVPDDGHGHAHGHSHGTATPHTHGPATTHTPGHTSPTPSTPAHAHTDTKTNAGKGGGTNVTKPTDSGGHGHHGKDDSNELYKPRNAGINAVLRMRFGPM